MADEEVENEDVRRCRVCPVEEWLSFDHTSQLMVNSWSFYGQSMGVFALASHFVKNVKCVRETEILVEQQTPQGVFVCDHAGLVINKSPLVEELWITRSRPSEKSR